MTKAKTKLMVTLMSVIACVCLMFATATMRPTYADGDLNSVSISNFTMYDGASIRPADADSNNKIGLRFLASMEISDEDFALLKANEKKNKYSVTFGMIIAPSDIVNKEGAPEFKLNNGWSEAGEEYVYANIEAFPQLDENDFDKDGVKTDYVLICSLVDIKLYNISRPFTARAYYQIGNNAVVHTENTAERAIYTVASKSIMAKLVTSTNNPTMYDALKVITDTVEDEINGYTKTTLEASGELAVSGDNFKVTNGSEVVFKLFLSNPTTGRKLNRGYHPYAGDGANAVPWNIMGDYSDWNINEDSFILPTRAEDPTDWNKGQLINFVYGYDADNKPIKIYTRLQWQNAILWFDGVIDDTAIAQNLMDEKDKITVMEGGEIVENPDLVITGADTISNNTMITTPTLSITYRSQKYYHDQTDDANKKEYSITAKLNTNTYINRAIEYGAYKEGEFTDATVSSKTYPASEYAIEGIKAGASLSTALMIKNVTLDTSEKAEEKQLIRFQSIPTNLSTSSDGAVTQVSWKNFGQTRTYISFIDADDPTNYITVLLTNRANATNTKRNELASIAARANVWRDYYEKNAGKDNMKAGATGAGNFAGLNNKGAFSLDGCIMATTSYNNRNAGGGYNGTALSKFSIAGYYLGDAYTGDDYGNYMLGLSIKGSKVYFTNAGTTTLLFDFVETLKSRLKADGTQTIPMSGSNPRYYSLCFNAEKPEQYWYGFGKTADDYAKNSATNVDGKKINICITSEDAPQSNKMNYLLIDMIDGVQITADNANDYIKNMSYVYVGNYFVPQV